MQQLCVLGRSFSFQRQQLMDEETKGERNPSNKRIHIEYIFFTRPIRENSNKAARLVHSEFALNEPRCDLLVDAHTPYLFLSFDTSSCV